MKYSEQENLRVGVLGSSSAFNFGTHESLEARFLSICLLGKLAPPTTCQE